MKRVSPGDLIAVRGNQKHYYVLVLDRVRLFGGHLVFALHRTSDDLLTADDVLNGPLDGFVEFVDLIFAKREDRIERLRSKLDVSPWLRRATLFKNTFTIKGKARRWTIYDAAFRALKQVTELSQQEKGYPLFHRIGDGTMMDLVDRRWTPEQDERI